MLAGYVFVVTYGRSGSTLLQAILNGIDGYKINGENYNALLHLFRSCRSIDDAYEKWGQTTPVRGWSGADQLEVEAYKADLLAAFIKRVLRPEAGTRVAGFKEIRYGESSEAEFFALIKFIEAGFPNAKILFNKRNAGDVSQSSWWKNQDPEKVFMMLKRMDHWFDKARKESPSSRFVVNYDNYIANPGSLKGMFEFLGESFDEKKVKQILAVSV